MTTSQSEREIHTSDRMLLGGRLYGRRTEQDQNLLGQIYTAEKHVVLALPNKGNVHILPQAKLDALLAAARAEEREAVLMKVARIPKMEFKLSDVKQALTPTNPLNTQV